MTKKVLIINTGGTITMQASQQGMSTAATLLDEIVDQAIGAYQKELPNYEIIDTQPLPLIDSGNMTPAYWNQMAELISKHYHHFDGFLILHGTDTMAYSASALSYALGNLSKAVILTGSQIPIAKLRNDAVDNFIHALLFAAMPSIHEVCLYFNHQLLRGNRSTKYSANGFSAFKSPNYPALASVGVEITLHPDNQLNKSHRDFYLTSFKEKNIAVVKLYPGMNPQFLENISQVSVDGLIIESYGKGGFPANQPGFSQALEKIAALQVPIVVCSQCPEATVDFAVYEVSQIYLAVAALSAADMTFEAALTKMHYLLSQELSFAQFGQQFTQPRAGDRSAT